MRGQRVRRLPWLVVGGLVFAALLLATFGSGTGSRSGLCTTVLGAV